MAQVRKASGTKSREKTKQQKYTLVLMLQHTLWDTGTGEQR